MYLPKSNRMFIWMMVFIAFIISCIISQMVCYYILDEILFGVIFRSLVPSILCRIFLAGTLFLAFGFLLRWEYVNGNLYKLILMNYLLLILTLSMKGATWRSYNLNILRLFDDIHRFSIVKWFILGNLIMYIPVGHLISKLLNKGSVISALLGICFILAIEISQYIFMLGVMDINDMLLNTIGLCIGIGLQVRKQNHKESQ